jgi:hypothetical protein
MLLENVNCFTFSTHYFTSAILNMIVSTILFNNILLTCEIIGPNILRVTNPVLFFIKYLTNWRRVLSSQTVMLLGTPLQVTPGPELGMSSSYGEIPAPHLFRRFMSEFLFSISFSILLISIENL